MLFHFNENVVTLLTVSNNRKKIVILISHQTPCCLIFSFMIITGIVINAKLWLISIYENVNYCSIKGIVIIAKLWLISIYENFNKHRTLNVYWIFILL